MSKKRKASTLSVRTKTFLGFAIIIFFYYLPVVILIALPHPLLKAAHIFSVFLIFIFFLMIHRIGKHVFQKKTSFKLRPFLKTLGYIWLIQIATLICTFGMFIAAIHATPSTKLPNFIQLSASYGLFPWSIYSLTAILFSYYTYQNHTPAHYTSGLPYFKNTHSDATLKRIVAMATSGSCIFCAILLLIMSAIFISDLLTQLLHLPSLQNLSINSLILGLLLLFITFSEDAQNILQYWIKLGATYGAIFAFILGFVAALFFILNVVTYVSGNFAQFANIIPNIPFEAPNATLIHMAYIGWCLSITPLVASAYVRFIQPYSIRTGLGMTLSLPLISVISITCFPSMTDFFTNSTFLPYWKACSLLGVVILVAIFLFEKNSKRFVTGFLPCPKEQTLLSPVKLKRSMKALVLISGLTTLTYLFFGSRLHLMLLFALSPFLFMIQLWLILTFCIYLIRRYE